MIIIREGSVIGEVPVNETKAAVLGFRGGATLKVAPIFDNVDKALYVEGPEGFEPNVCGIVGQYGLEWVSLQILRLVGMTEKQLREIL